MLRYLALSSVWLAVALISACSTATPPPPTATAVAQVAGATAEPTAVPPTAEPEPTAEPTAVPPTAVPEPTAVPPTAVPPTAEPEPVAQAPAEIYLDVLPQSFDGNGAPTLGLATAPIVLIDYSDFLCPTCQSHVFNVEPLLIEEYVRRGVVQLGFRPVLNHGERSLRTSEAAFCAGQQGGFWAMHSLLFARMDQVWATPELEQIALMRQYITELGLDPIVYDGCVASGDALTQVQSLDAEQRSRGIIGQPTFEVNGVRLVGYQSFERFQQVIASLR